MEQGSDEALILNCKKQDRKAQELLFRKYSSAMLGICVRYLKNRDAAKDLLHDGFIKIFEKINSFNGNSSLHTWMTRIFINLSLDCLRKNMKHELRDEFEIMEQYSIENYHENDVSIGNVSGEQVMEAVIKLPIKYRVVINLFVIDEYSHKEISNILGIPEGTSKSHVSRGLKLMEKMLTSKELKNERA